ncbi:MAG TPA: DUF2069 domain-containing protein [Rudaea sp.]
MSALRLGWCALVALVVLQLAWHLWIAPPATALWPTLAIAIVPLLPGLWVSLRNLRRGVLIGAIVSLFYFCHGISELWSAPAPRALAAGEVALTLLLIGASGWDARKYRRKPKTDR